MPNFAANISMMFTEWEFLDRFDAAAEAGFTAVEYMFPYEYPAATIAERQRRNGLTPALFNMPPGNLEAGERGLAALADRFADVKDGVALALEYAEASGAKCLHLMAGIADATDPQARLAYRNAVTYAAGMLADHGICVLLEPINARNVPGYFLNDFAMAETLIGELAIDNLKLQFDIYHRQIMHGDVVKALERLLPIIGHVQTAGVPERHEPGSGELNDAFVFAALERLGYRGFVGCEYIPAKNTLDGLGWFADSGLPPR
jgi:hydroxypyruvate isomerase